MLGKLGQHAKALTDAAKARLEKRTAATLIVGFMDRKPYPGRDGRCRVRLGITGCPNDTTQIVFCANDEGLLTGEQPLENELCQVVKTNPAKGIIWSPEDEYWSVSGDCKFYAIGIRGDGYFATSAGLCEAIENWYKLSNSGSVPTGVAETVEYLIENNGAKLEARKWDAKRR